MMKVPSYPETSRVCEALARTDREEIIGNRMTCYPDGLGGGSIQYWDGVWSNNADVLPHAMLAVYEGHDGNLLLRGGQGRVLPLRRYFHQWRPDQVASDFLTADRIVVKERKTIWNDVFVSRIALYSALKRPVTLRLCHEAEREAGLEVEIIDGGILHLCAARGQLAGVHRLIALLPGAADVRVNRRAYAITRPVTVPANTGRVTEPVYAGMVVAMGLDLDETLQRLRTALDDPEQAFVLRRRDWETYYDKHVPGFRCSDPLQEKLYNHAFYVAKANLFDFRQPSITQPYTCPSKLRLMPQWFWDSAFQAIQEKWTHGYPFPKSCIRNCLAAQKPDGHLPFIHHGVGDGDMLEQNGYHRMIQPFILPLAIWDGYLKNGDRRFLAECLPRLAAFDRWMRRERDPRKEWLVNLNRPGESGWDNSKRYLPKGLAATPETCGLKAVPIQPVDFNTYVYLGRHLIRRMAVEVGDADTAAEYAPVVRHTAAAIGRMYDPRLGLFVDKFTGESRTSTIKSAGGLVPLISGLATRAQSRSLVRHLLNPAEFWSAYPVPTLSMDDPGFTCADGYQSYWNGRAWPNVTWLILEGLFRAGEIGAAGQLLERFLASGVNRGEPFLTENYHPLQPYCYDINQNSFCYGWGGLMADTLIRRAVGIQPNLPRGEVIINPVPPPHWTHAALTDLRLGKHRLDVELKCGRGDRQTVRIRHRGPEKLRIIVGPAASFDLKNEAVETTVRSWKAPHWLDL
jgi:hypothetical protein